MTKGLYVLLISIITNQTLVAQSIIPLPEKMNNRNGIFDLSIATSIHVRKDMLPEVLQFNEQLKNISGYELRVNDEDNEEKGNTIIIKQGPGITEEGYQLEVTPEKITIQANDDKGVFYALISLLQLLPNEVSSKRKDISILKIPAIDISDHPRFKWRGLMLDCSRTFISPSYIKETIRRMAFYKLNILHLHLTDDQGWRLEIKSLPELTSRSCYFDRHFNEPKEFQGYYAQQDIRDIVEYAAQKHIQIIPEIESPGHSLAALNAYPELSCVGHVLPIYPFFSGPEITQDLFCVGNPASYAFYKNVLAEVIRMFPSPYIHLGGDEVPPTRWEECAKCQRLVKQNALADTRELGGYFMQQIALNAIKSNKRPIAWNEVFEQKKYINTNWIIMNWGSSKAALDAVKEGYDVVMAPTSHLYFDYTYEQINTKKVFEFDPYYGEKDDGLLKSHILGIQALFWSHIDRTESRIDYQLYPRLLALAERAWSSTNDINYNNFKSREEYHKEHWLKNMQIAFNGND